MRVYRILLLLSLLAVALYLHAPPSAPAQQSNTVTIRPRKTSSQPGIPEVTAAADRVRVPVGDKVTFTLSPASVIKNRCYQVTLFFGDDASEIVRQPQTVHVYQQSGNYTYSILVRPVAACGPTPTPTPVSTPNVRLIVEPTSVEVKESVTFVAELSRPAREFRYRFVFDDGSESGWQSDPKASHAYDVAKTYRPYVEIGVPAGSSARSLGGSKRQTVEVRQSPRPIIIVVKLSVNPRAADAGTPIRFIAQAKASRPVGLRYRFDFGDQTQSQWQTAAIATHSYAAAGKYDARVDVQPIIPSAAQGVTSDPIAIAIAKPQEKQTVELNVVPTSVPPGIPVFFSAIARGADSETRYRFNFGDGSPRNWSSQPIQTHSYTSPRSYRASVEMRTSGGATVVSSDKRITIIPGFPTPTPTPTPRPTPSATGTPRPSPSPTVAPTASPTASPSPAPTASPTASTTTAPTASPTATASAIASPAAGQTPTVVGSTSWLNDRWPYLVLLPLLMLAGYKAVMFFLLPRPTFVPHPTAGTAKASGLAFNYEVDVDPNVDGAFKIDAAGGNLIKAKRTSDD
jgi:hypothetical protein